MRKFFEVPAVLQKHILSSRFVAPPAQRGGATKPILSPASGFFNGTGPDSL
jgi:hypothetical protein